MTSSSTSSVMQGMQGELLLQPCHCRLLRPLLPPPATRCQIRTPELRVVRNASSSVACCCVCSNKLRSRVRSQCLFSCCSCLVGSRCWFFVLRQLLTLFWQVL